MEKLSIESKKQFVAENMNLIPANRVESFKMLDIDVQYKRMREQMFRAKRKTNPTFYDSVKKHLKSRDADMSELIKVSKLINTWISNNDVRRATEIEKQIAKLQSELDVIKSHKAA